MRLIARSLLYLLVTAAALRMLIYLAYAAAQLTTPLEAYHLESKMVLLSWRSQHGLSLYPAWWDFPHVANFFGPVDFVLVGLLGRLVDADVPGLFSIGRAVTFVSCLLTTVILGVWIGRRYGRGAGLAGALISMGSGPMFGFSVMVRPDVPAELLGLGGFLLSGSRSRSRAVRIGGVALLILAVLTKQTTVVFLVAASLSLACEGRRRTALGILGGAVAGLCVVVIAVNARVEPHFARSLVGEAGMPWDFKAWRALLTNVAITTPDLLVFPAVGLWFWLAQRPRDVRPAALVLVLLASSLGLSGKVGADLNYYLSLRIAEAMAVGVLWHVVHADLPAGRPWPWPRSLALATISTLALVSIAPCIVAATRQAVHAWEVRSFFRGSQGRVVLASHRAAIAIARDPRVRLLTDSGLLDLYQGERALYGDPWLFRKLIDTGRLRPTTVAERLDTRYYDMIITSSDLDAPGYSSHDFRMPVVLAGRARRNYVLRDIQPGFFYYGRRGGVWPPLLD